MLSFTERLSRDVARAARMTLPELEQALQTGENCTVSRLTALSLAKKAAEGGMDAIKMIRELTKWHTATEGPKAETGDRQALVEIRVVEPGSEQG